MSRGLGAGMAFWLAAGTCKASQIPPCMRGSCSPPPLLGGTGIEVKGTSPTAAMMFMRPNSPRVVGGATPPTTRAKIREAGRVAASPDWGKDCNGGDGGVRGSSWR